MARVQDAVNANGGDLWGDKQWWEKIEKGVKSWRALYALVQHGASLKKGCHPTHGKGYIAGIEKALGAAEFPTLALVWGGDGGPELRAGRASIARLEAAQQKLQQQLKAQRKMEKGFQIVAEKRCADRSELSAFPKVHTRVSVGNRLVQLGLYQDYDVDIETG